MAKQVDSSKRKSFGYLYNVTGPGSDYIFVESRFTRTEIKPSQTVSEDTCFAGKPI